MRRIQLKAHLSVEEIEQRYRTRTEGVERSQWHIIWLLSQGKVSEEEEAVTGYGVQWIRTLARRYNAGEPAAWAIDATPTQADQGR